MFIIKHSFIHSLTHSFTLLFTVTYQIPALPFCVELDLLQIGGLIFLLPWLPLQLCIYVCRVRIGAIRGQKKGVRSLADYIHNICHMEYLSFQSSKISLLIYCEIVCFQIHSSNERFQTLLANVFKSNFTQKTLFFFWDSNNVISLLGRYTSKWLSDHFFKSMTFFQFSIWESVRCVGR